MTDLAGSAHKDRTTRITIAAWPRLMNLSTASAYTCLGISTIRDYCNDGILAPVQMPGSILRDKQGNIIAHSKARKIAKILIDKSDLDRLIDDRKVAQ